MGQEIKRPQYNAQDEAFFREKLREETKVVKRWFDEKAFSKNPPQCGLELEAWLVTRDFIPAPQSDLFLKELSHPLIVPEISKFNFEINSHPVEIKGHVFSQLEKEVLGIWKKSEQFAESKGLRAILIGTLPTLRDYMLTMDYLSPQKRYFVLNKRIMKLREGLPIKIDIRGVDRVSVEHHNVITECAATSLQIHFGVTQENGPKYYNASIVASAFMAAACANSPFFYGKELWDETRIPIFEQSVNLKSFRKISGRHATRVGLGNGYLRHSLFELFIENLDGYRILLPDHEDSSPTRLNHLRLHNGTIWRWNRPLITPPTKEGGPPALRLEFRVPSSGPSIKDAVANVALQLALVEYFYHIENLEDLIPFNVAEKNFYSASQKGFSANVQWIDGKKYNIQGLLLNTILPEAQKLLLKWPLEFDEVEKYLHYILASRFRSGQNGAFWQKSFVDTHGFRFQEMLEMYYDFQKENLPVHLWHV